MIGLGGEVETRCSRAGCGQVATVAVNWRNPKIHTADRVKTWLACDEHREFLRDYLETRDFPVVISPLDDIPVSLAGSAPGGTG